MSGISFKINGQKVTPGNIGNSIESTILKSIQDSVKRSVSSVRCNKHGQGPKIEFKGRNLDSLSFEVTGCCEHLVKEVNRKIEF